GTAVADALDAGEKREALAVLGLRENQDRADLRDRLGENRRRQRSRAVGGLREKPLVQRHVLDAHNPLVDLEFGDPVDEEKRIAVEQNLLDRRVVERERQFHRIPRLYWSTSRHLTIRLF